MLSAGNLDPRVDNFASWSWRRNRLFLAKIVEVLKSYTPSIKSAITTLDYPLYIEPTSRSTIFTFYLSTELNKARRSTSREFIRLQCCDAKSSSSISLSCARNLGFGDTCSRARRTFSSAASKDMPRSFMRYAATTVGERETPAEQWTRILPRPLSDCEANLMMSTEVLTMGATDDIVESLRESR